MSVKTILFVENDPVSLAMYKHRLEREGFHIEAALDGVEALDILSKRPPDLILLDLMLPKLSGEDVLKFMQADPRLATLPVIIFSNAPLTECPPDSPLAQGIKRLVKSECDFPKLLGAINETLANAPEFVVVEANAPPPTAPPPAAVPLNMNVKEAPPPVPVDDDVSKKRAEFLKEAAAAVPKIREHSLAYIKSPSSPAGNMQLAELHRRANALHTGARDASCDRVALLMKTFEALLAGISAKPSLATPSALQTIAQTVDCLANLLKNDESYFAEPITNVRVLVVDDDPVCNHVNVSSLKRADYEAVGVKDPVAALELLESSSFDLVVLDVNMPGLTGFDVCERMRRFPHCKNIPAIFVTAYSNFDNRKQSVLSGGNDFVTKPVSPLELALKVTVHLIKAKRTGQGKPDPAGASAPATPAAHGVAVESVTSTQTSHPDIPTAPPPGFPPTPPPAAVPTQPTAATEPALQVPTTESATTNVEPVAPEMAVPVHEPAPAAIPDGAAPHAVQPAPHAAQPAGTAPHSQPSGDVQGLNDQLTRLTAELESAKTAAQQTESALKEKEVLCSLLEQDVANLRRLRDDLEAKVNSGQEQAAKLQQETNELRDQAARHGNQADQAKAGHEQQSAEWGRVEQQLREQLACAKAASDKAESVIKEKEALCYRLEKELSGLRQSHDDLHGKATAGAEAIAQAQQQISELQGQLTQARADLDRTRAGAEQQTAERTRVEAELRKELADTKGNAEQLGAQLQDKQAAFGRLEKDLAAMRENRDELQHKLETEHDRVAKARKENKELHEKLHESQAEIERLKTRLEEGSTERARLEKELRGQLDAAHAATAKAAAAIKEKETRCHQLDEELAQVQQARQELTAKVEAGEKDLAKVRQESSEFEELFRQSEVELGRAKANLDKAAVERSCLESERLRLEAEVRELSAAKESLQLDLNRMREEQAAHDAEQRDKHTRVLEALRESVMLMEASLQSEQPK